MKTQLFVLSLDLHTKDVVKVTSVEIAECLLDPKASRKHAMSHAFMTSVEKP